MKKKRALSVFLGATVAVTQALSPFTAVAATTSDDVAPVAKAAASTGVKSQGEYGDRFQRLYSKIKDKNNGYFGYDGIPYHSVETLMFEAPDQGHESTSEAASYYVWLEAMYGRYTGDFSGVNEAWRVIEDHFIPEDGGKDAKGNEDTFAGQLDCDYPKNHPADYAPEMNNPEDYPARQDHGAAVGQDTLVDELTAAYKMPASEMYGMHWLLDVDDFYEFGKNQGLSGKAVYINTFQRGKNEGVFRTIPQPCWENFGAGGENGYLPYFAEGSGFSKQWKYTIASDADARVVQAMHRANENAKETGSQSQLKSDINKTVQMGDYLRYSMFDKYFKDFGIGDTEDVPGEKKSTGDKQKSYLLSWYYAWGGSMGTDYGGWSWKISSSHCHFGYQNPYAAWVLAEDSDFTPKSTNGKSDWANSLDRQLEFYQWLQSDEGGIAGGATNNYITDSNENYANYPAGTATFYGMAYQEHPVYNDPGSNQWFGMQCWSMQRIAELYYDTANDPADAETHAKCKKLMDKWAAWAASEVEITTGADGKPDYQIPGTLAWEGQPDTWTGEYEDGKTNTGLHVKVVEKNHDIGCASSLANTLTYYAAGLKADDATGNADLIKKYVGIAQKILTIMEDRYGDEKGIGDPGSISYTNQKRIFEDPVSIRSDYSGTMPNGDIIKSGVSTFWNIRSNYNKDVNANGLKEAYAAGKDYDITYHRFWANCEAAIANAVMDQYFPTDINSGDIEDPTTEKVTTTEAPTTTEKVTTTEAPTTTEKVTTTEAPTTTEKVTTTEAPTTTEKVTTTEAPTTTEKVTTTEAPTTTEKVTTTEAPTTTEKVTTTEAPTTTEKVTTTEPKTDAPTTQAQTTEPKTDAPTTQAQTTEPKTDAPTSTEPKTDAPTTQAQTTTKTDEQTSTGQEDIPVQSVYMKGSSLALFQGETGKLEYVVNPSNATIKDVKWDSSDTSVVFVDSEGNYVAAGKGTANVTVTVNGKKSNATTITVIEKTEPTTTGSQDVTTTNGNRPTENPTTGSQNVPLESVILNQSSLSMFEGDKEVLTYTLNPSNATVTGTPNWSSDNDSVATVDNSGVVTARSEGRANITLEIDGKKATTVINVTKKEQPQTTTQAPTTTAGQDVTTEAPTTTAGQDASTEAQTTTAGQDASTEAQTTTAGQDASTEAQTTTQAPQPTQPTTTQTPQPTQPTQPTTTQAPQTTQPTTQAPTSQTAAIEKKLLKVGTRFVYKGVIYKVAKSSVTKRELKVVGATKNVKKVSIVSQIKKNGLYYKVLSVHIKAFKNNKKITSVTTGANVRTIGKQAFYGCTNLKTVSLNKNVKNIDAQAFYGCKKLKAVSVKTSKLTLRTVKSKAFAKINNKVVIRVLKKKLKTYKNILIKRGASRGIKVRF